MTAISLPREAIYGVLLTHTQSEGHVYFLSGFVTWGFPFFPHHPPQSKVNPSHWHEWSLFEQVWFFKDRSEEVMSLLAVHLPWPFSPWSGECRWFLYTPGNCSHRLKPVSVNTTALDGPLQFHRTLCSSNRAAGSGWELSRHCLT